MNFQKSILILKPGIESNVNTNEHDSIELFKRDARMHICKCKHEENQNKILKRRLIIRKQLQSNPHLADIVRMYDDYYEEFKTKIIMQIGALEKLLKYLKNLESSKHKTHYHHHHHHHHTIIMLSGKKKKKKTKTKKKKTKKKKTKKLKMSKVKI